ncbi:MAG: energy transducer TonB [Bacteroidota bacterium]|jgi:TonB family protein
MKKIVSGIIFLIIFSLAQKLMAQTQPKDTIYRLVEVYPSFKGGNIELQKFIHKTAKYPTEALKAKQEGIVDVHFVVKKDGSLQQIKTNQKGNALLEQEAIRIVKSMPNWNTGMMYNKAVDTYFSISVLFSRKDTSVSWFNGDHSLRAKDKKSNHQTNEHEKLSMVNPPNDKANGKVDSNSMEQGLQILESNEKPDEEEILLFAEQMAEFPGDLKRYIGKNLNYPEAAKAIAQEGKVVVQFTIGKDGKISDIIIIKKAGYGFDEEVIRLIENMPDWKPAIQNGKPVNLRYTLPIDFKLS